MLTPSAPALLLLLALPLAGAARSEQFLHFGEPGGTVEVAGLKLPENATQLTVELRFKALERLLQPVKLVSRWSDAPGAADRGSFYLGFNSTSQLVLGLRNAQGIVKTVAGGAWRPGAWHHAAAVWNGDEAVIYLDGKPVMTQKIPDLGPLAPTALPLVVGQPPEKDRKPAFFEGFVGDVAVWSTARDAASIAQGLTQPLSGTEPGLAVFLPLREASPRATVKDRTAAGLEGRLSESLARAGWCVTPAWNDPSPDRPYLHLFGYDLSAPARSEDGPPAPAPSGAGRQILVSNEKTRQAGVLWQDASTKAVRVTWVDAALSGHRTLALSGMSDGTLLAGTSDPQGNLYYVMVQQAPPGRAESLVLKGAAHLVRPDGKPARELPLDLSANAFNYFSDGGRGSMAFANGFVGLILPRTMYMSGDGLHHQAAVAAAFPADLSGVQLLGHTSSHSFGNVLVPGLAGDLLGIDLGDNYPRGVHLHRISRAAKGSRVVFTYKTAHGTEARNGSPVYPEISGKGKTFFKWSNDNGTYTELGGVVEGQVSCTVIFATDRSPEGKVLDNSRIGVAGDPRDLAMLRVAKNFEKGPGGGSEVPDALMVPGNPPGAPPETGGFYDFGGGWSKQRVTGVIWLTSYKPGEAAHAPHLLRRRDGSLLVLWEKTGPDGPSLWAMTVHESGRKLTEPIRLGVDLHLQREDPVLRIGNRLFLLAREKGGRTRLCHINDD
jgi:hypothetical protein